MSTGKVKFFNSSSSPQKNSGFGFIIDDSDNSEVFVHLKDLNGLAIKKDDRLSFETEETKKGIKAINIKKL